MTDHVRVRAAPLDPERAAEAPCGIFIISAGDIKLVSIGDGHAVEVTMNLDTALEFAGLLIDRVDEEARRQTEARATAGHRAAVVVN